MLFGCEDIMKKDSMKKYNKYIFRLTRIIILIGMICGSYYVLDFAVSEDYSDQSREPYHDYYAMEHVDNLFVGTSHTGVGIDTVKLSELTSEECFNLGSNRQYLLISNYIIEEALNRKNVDRIFFEISLDSLLWEMGDETYVYLVSDYMNSQMLRCKLINESIDSTKYMNAFFRARRDNENFKNINKMKKIIRAKRKDDYRDYKGDLYLGNGHWKSKRDYPLWYHGENMAVNLDYDGLDNYRFSEVLDFNWKIYENIIRSCSSSDTELVIYVMPMQGYYLKCFEEYNQIIDNLRQMANLYGVKLIDLNELKKEYLDIDISEFKDFEHLTSEGSKKVADFFARYIADPDGDYFNNDWTDNYSSSEIFAVGYHSYYITEKGEFPKKKSAEGTIINERIELTACAMEDMPVYIKVFEVERVKDDASAEIEVPWTVVDEIETQTIDDYTSEIVINYNDDAYYKVELYSQDDNELIYEAVTKFDME